MEDVPYEQHAGRSECRVRGAAHVLLRVSRACGAAPVTSERQRSFHVVRVSRRYATIANIIVFILGVTMLAALLVDIHSEMARGSLPKYVVASLIIKFFNYLMTSVMFIVGTFGAAGRMRRFVSYIKQIQKMLATVDDIPTCKALEQALSVVLAGGATVVIVSCVLNIVIAIYEALHFHPNFVVDVIYMSGYAGHVVSSLLVLQIAFVIMAALWTLTALNGNLRMLQVCKQQEGVIKDDGSAVVDALRRFAATYASVHDVCSRINAGEGFTMLFLLTEFIFRVLAFTLHTIAATYKYKDSPSWMYAAVAGQVLQLVRVGLQMVVVVELCHRTYGELKRTPLLISRLLCAQPSAADRVSVALLRFYEVTSPCGYVFTPLGTFRFSRSLYTAVLGVLTTLIVIIARV